MKSALGIVLGISAIINAVLLVGDPRAQLGSSAAGMQARVGAPSPASAGATAAEQAAARAASREKVVSMLESNDLATLRDRLRAEGFPETMVRALVGRRIEDTLEARRMARFGTPGVQPFWKTHDPASERARRAFERELSRDQRAMHMELLGTVPTLPEMRSFASERYGFLPPDKAQVLQGIEADYGEIAAEARGDFMVGGQTTEDRERQQMIEREKRADIAAVLAPEEFELYELYYSPTASAARNRFRSFEPTEEEFRAVYALQKVFEERFGSMSGPPTAADAAARSAAQRELSTQFRAVLGEARFAEYERVNSPAYRAAVRIAEQYRLPRENADAVYGLEVEFRRRQSDATRGATDAGQRAEAMRALAAEASARVTELLGAEGAKVFREQGGSWFRSLEQQAQNVATPRP